MMNLRAVLLMSLMVLTAIAAFGQNKAIQNKSANCQKNEGYVLFREVCENGIDWRNLTITEALMKSFAVTKTPAGVAILFENHDKKEVSRDLTPDGLTLNNILNNLVTIEPHYRWREESGVVNFYPTEDYGILNVKIPEFKFENLTKGELLDKLTESKQFKDYLKENDLRAPALTVCCGLQSPRAPRRFSVDLKNSSVREILNEIVRRNGSSTWLYREYEAAWNGKVNRYFSLYFLVDSF